MTIENRISAFEKLGDFLNGFTSSNTDNTHALEKAIQQIVYKNGWFTPENIRSSISAISYNLNRKNLSDWVAKYSIDNFPKKRVSIIMAGNIPLVGFHDFLCVLLSGHRVMAKMSSEDDKLLPVIADFLICFYPEVAKFISFSDRNMKGFDAVIATGSNTSFVHFEQYFSKYPHIFRKNRTSVAVLDGKETEAELLALGNDVFDFFGRGCRSVSHLILPDSYNINKVFEHIVSQGAVINNKKYGNNYDYNKAVHLMNQEKLLDNNFVLLKESDTLSSPLGMLYYHFYKNK